jgi:hypothetical protein
MQDRWVLAGMLMPSISTALVISHNSSVLAAKTAALPDNNKVAMNRFKVFMARSPGIDR